MSVVETRRGSLDTFRLGSATRTISLFDEVDVELEPVAIKHYRYFLEELLPSLGSPKTALQDEHVQKQIDLIKALVVSPDMSELTVQAVVEEFRPEMWIALREGVVAHVLEDLSRFRKRLKAEDDPELAQLEKGLKSLGKDVPSDPTEEETQP